MAGVPEQGSSRREFLQRTAYAAGLAGVAGLPAATLLAEAAEAAHRRSPLPRARDVEIDHFVVLMMENRSFDHYFGWVPGAADAVQQQSFPDPSGQQVPTRHFSTLGSGGMEYKGCGHPDPGHGWDSGRAQLLGGFLAPGSGNDEYALTYFNRGELGFIHEAARQYTLYDRFFCSVLSSTWPNRYYKWSAQAGGRKDNSPPIATAAPGAPPLAGVVEQVLDETIVVRTGEPTPGIVEMSAWEWDGLTHVTVRGYLYGDQAPAAAAREEPAWRAWLEERFPPAEATGAQNR